MSANISVFDISKKDQISEIYSLGEVLGERIINDVQSERPLIWIILSHFEMRFSYSILRSQ